jgi:primase-polymerase (primpol)-like protein
MISNINDAEGSLNAMEGYPVELQKYKQWLLYALVWNERLGKYGKVPKRNKGGYLVAASKVNQADFMSYTEALTSVQIGVGDGIGFCITPNDPFLCIDLDKCLGQQFCWDIINQFDSASEISLSGNGAHIFIEANKLEGTGTKSTKFFNSQIELLGDGCFVALTGKYNGKPICNRQTTFDAFSKPLRDLKLKTKQVSKVSILSSKTANEVVTRLRSDIRHGVRFNALYHGNGLTEDASADDQSLCNLIAPYADHDEGLIDDIFRSSARYRDKWERQDYRDNTIANAVSESNPIRKYQSATEAFKGMAVLNSNCAPNLPLLPNTNPFKSKSLRGQSAQLERQALDDRFVLEQLAILGQMTIFSAPPNAGKTLITLKLLGEAIKANQIDPDKVYYFNADDNAKGTRVKNRYAEKVGFHMLVPGFNGFKTDDLTPDLKVLVANQLAVGAVIILDTIKKFADLMNKSNISEFTKRLREFVQAGGTVIALSHVNKNKDHDGKHIYAGTSDLRDDADCAYTISIKNEELNDYRIVEFENTKMRGDVSRFRLFKYSIKQGIGYNDLLDSVNVVDDKQAKDIESSKSLKADMKIIVHLGNAINDGHVKRTELINHVHVQLKPYTSRKEIERVLSEYENQRWHKTIGDKNSHIYSVSQFPNVPPIPTH